MEGMALLRAWHGDFDEQFVRARLDEVRRPARRRDAAQSSRCPGRSPSRRTTPTVSGPTTYDDPGNALLELDLPVIDAMLDGLPVGHRGRHRLRDRAPRPPPGSARAPGRGRRRLARHGAAGSPERCRRPVRRRRPARPAARRRIGGPGDQRPRADPRPRPGRRCCPSSPACSARAASRSSPTSTPSSCSAGPRSRPRARRVSRSWPPATASVADYLRAALSAGLPGPRLRRAPTLRRT